MTTFAIPSFVGHDFPANETGWVARFMARFHSVEQLDFIREELAMCAAEVAENGRMDPKHARWLKALDQAKDLRAARESDEHVRRRRAQRQAAKPLTKDVDTGYGTTRTCYTAAGLEAIAPLIAKAQAIADAELEKQPRPHEGTCILGAGVALYEIPPRCRNPRHKLVVQVNAQGSIAIERSLKPALEYLEANGVHCYLDHGNMD